MSHDPHRELLDALDFASLEKRIADQAMAHGTVFLHMYYDAMGAHMQYQIITDWRELSPTPVYPTKAACDDLSYLDDPKYKRLLAQYERARQQRNKHLMRDLEKQLKFMRGY